MALQKDVFAKGGLCNRVSLQQDVFAESTFEMPYTGPHAGKTDAKYTEFLGLKLNSLFGDLPAAGAHVVFGATVWWRDYSPGDDGRSYAIHNDALVLRLLAMHLSRAKSCGCRRRPHLIGCNTLTGACSWAQSYRQTCNFLWTCPLLWI